MKLSDDVKEFLWSMLWTYFVIMGAFIILAATVATIYFGAWILTR